MSAKSYTLYPHQTRGSSWLQETEKRFGGGILADEMGLGKTIQIIDMMLSNPKRKNLVVAPASLVTQWQTEINKFTNSIDVYVRPTLKTFIDSKRQTCVRVCTYEKDLRDHLRLLCYHGDLGRVHMVFELVRAQIWMNTKRYFKNMMARQIRTICAMSNRISGFDVRKKCIQCQNILRANRNCLVKQISHKHFTRYWTTNEQLHVDFYPALVLLEV